MRRAAAFLLAVCAVLPAGVRQQAVATCVTRVLVLSAFPGELDRIVSEIASPQAVAVDGRIFFAGTLRGHAVVAGLSGIGLVNAERSARAALDAIKCGDEAGIGAVVFSGVAGGPFIGDVAVPARWTPDDGATWFAADSSMLDAARDVAAAGVALAQDVPLGDPACAGVDPRAVTTIRVPHVPQIIVGGDGESSDGFGGRALPCFPGGGDVFGCEACRAPVHAVPDGQRFVRDATPFLDPGFFFGYFAAPPVTGSYDAQDMETAAVAKVASEAGVPFIAFRAASDGQGDPLMLPGFPFQFFVYRQLAADNAAAVALAFLDEWSG